jgi:hypothetical protein
MLHLLLGQIPFDDLIICNSLDKPQRMKHLYVIGILCLFLISWTQNRASEFSTQDFFNSGTITIAGQITNLSPDDSRTIFFSQYDILSGNDDVTSIKIDSSGKFEKVLPVFNPQEISLDYQNRLLNTPLL